MPCELKKYILSLCLSLWSAVSRDYEDSDLHAFIFYEFIIKTGCFTVLYFYGFIIETDCCGVALF